MAQAIASGSPRAAKGRAAKGRIDEGRTGRFPTIQRRSAPLTCAAYERDVSACLGYLQGQVVTRSATYLPPCSAHRRQPVPGAGAARAKHLDPTQRYMRVTAHELRGAVKRAAVGRLTGGHTWLSSTPAFPAGGREGVRRSGTSRLVLISSHLK